MLKHEKIYVEGELRYYASRKKMIKEVEECIIAETPIREVCIAPTGYSNVVMNKVFQLIDYRMLERWKETISAIDKSLLLLLDEHRELFDKFFIKKMHYRQVYLDMHISQAEFFRIRKDITISVGISLGIISL